MNWFKENKQWFFSGIGGVILTIVVTLFLTLKPTPNKNGISIGGNINSSGDTAIVENGNVNIDKNISDSSAKVNVSGHSYGDITVQGKNSTIIYGIQPEKYANLANEYGVTKAAIKCFFKIMDKKHVSPEDLDNTFRQIAKRHKALQERLKQFKYLIDTEVEQLREQAKKAIAIGEYDKADSYIDKAIQKQLDCVQGIEKQTKKCKLSTAEMKADKAEIQMVQINYKVASRLFKEAAELIPEGSELVKAEYLKKWGDACFDAGEYYDAEYPLKRSLTIRENILGENSIEVAAVLNNLAGVYKFQSRYEEAELMYRQSLKVMEKKFGLEHSCLVSILNNLALLYKSQDKHDEVEPLYKRSLRIAKKNFGSESQIVASTLNNLANFYKFQGKYKKAEVLYNHSLKITENILGKNHPNFASILNNLAGLYKSQGNYINAELMYKRSLKTMKSNLGAEHPHFASTLNNLAGLLEFQGKYKEAELLYRTSLKIILKKFGKDHPNYKDIVNNYLSMMLEKSKQLPIKNLDLGDFEKERKIGK